MKIISSKQCESLAHVAHRFINSRSVDIQDAVGDMTLHIGQSTAPEFQTPAGARDCLFIGDSAFIGKLRASDSVRQLYKTDKKRVAMYARYNSESGKWDMEAKDIGRQMDAAGDLLNYQTISPWTQSFFEDIFDRPLLYSHASDLVKTYQGTNPWAKVMNLYLADYGGAAVGLEQGGSPENSATKDVTVSSGIMSALVLNMFVTYSLTIEEQEMAKVNGNPFGSKLIQKKIQYANYVLQALTDYLTYYGNANTDTQGLFQVNAITTYAGNSLAQIADGTSQTKGSDAYAALSTILNDFFSHSYNKFDHVKVAMSTQAYNLLSSLPYSQQYNPTSPLAVFEKNYLGGRNTKEGNREPRVEFLADPLLDANTDFNSNKFDYLVITAPEVGTGPENEKKSVILQGMPLKEFVYPVVPGMVNQQHRMLRRYAGVYAPVLDSVKIYSGFGVKGA